MGLIGESISYSLSPIIHNQSAKTLQVQIDYGIFSLKANKVEKFLNQMWADEALGFNVTQPHKRLVAEIINHPTLSSVNTLFRGDEGFWSGTSTDPIGIATVLSKRQQPILNFAQIVLFGNGGATQSVLEYLDSHRFSGSVVVALRTLKDWSGFDSLKCLSPTIVNLYDTLLPKLLTRENTLFIQATSAPLNGDDLSRAVPLFENFSGVYFDMVYGHASAPFSYCQKRGIECVDGLPMLIEQARAAQQLWWGKADTFENIRKYLAQ